MRKLKLREGTNTAVLFGHHDRHLKLIEEDLGVRLSARGEELTLDGNPEATRYAERVLTELAGLANDGMLIQPDDVAHALTALRQSPETPLKELLSNATTIVTKKRFVAPKTPTQKTYIEAIETHASAIGRCGEDFGAASAVDFDGIIARAAFVEVGVVAGIPDHAVIAAFPEDLVVGIPPREDVVF